MRHVMLDMDGNANLLKTEEPTQDDLKAVHNGDVCLLQISETEIRWPDITCNQAEGEEEEDEYEVEWKLVK